MNQRDRLVKHPCMICGNLTKVVEVYDKHTSSYILIQPPVCDRCSHMKSEEFKIKLRGDNH